MHEIQKRLLETAHHIRLKGLTLRKIGSLIELQHPQLIKHHLNQLVKNGLLNRSYQPILKGQAIGSKLLNIPILGSANCGEPTRLAEENLEGFLKVSSSIIPTKRHKDLFALKVVGDSMNKAKTPIEDGDYIVVDRTATQPSNGNNVVSIIEGAANIKKFYFDKQNQLIYLLSESTRDYPPIVISSEDNFFINGKVITIIKKLGGGDKNGSN